jgi:hypothetical protein
VSPQDQEKETQRVLIHAATVISNVSTEGGWLRYVELGGLRDTFEIDAFLAGLICLPLADCNLFAQAINELIEEQPSHPQAPTATVPPCPRMSSSAATSSMNYSGSGSSD